MLQRVVSAVLEDLFVLSGRTFALRFWDGTVEGPSASFEPRRSRGTKDEKGEAAYLFGVSFSSVKRATLGDGPFQPQLKASTTDVYR
jgi:hypothetical protein